MGAAGAEAREGGKGRRGASEEAVWVGGGEALHYNRSTWWVLKGLACRKE